MQASAARIFAIHRESNSALKDQRTSAPALLPTLDLTRSVSVSHDDNRLRAGKRRSCEQQQHRQSEPGGLPPLLPPLFRRPRHTAAAMRTEAPGDESEDMLASRAESPSLANATRCNRRRRALVTRGSVAPLQPELLERSCSAGTAETPDPMTFGEERIDARDHAAISHGSAAVLDPVTTVVPGCSVLTAESAGLCPSLAFEAGAPRISSAISSAHLCLLPSPFLPTPTGCLQTKDGDEDGFKISTVLTGGLTGGESEINCLGCDKLAKRDRHRRAAAAVERPRGLGFKPAALHHGHIEEGTLELDAAEEHDSALCYSSQDEENGLPEFRCSQMEEEELSMHGQRGLREGLWASGGGRSSWSAADEDEGLSPIMQCSSSAFETPSSSPEGGKRFLSFIGKGKRRRISLPFFTDESLNERAAQMLASRRLAMQQAGINWEGAGEALPFPLGGVTPRFHMRRWASGNCRDPC